VKCPVKANLLRDFRRARCNLVGVVGRKAFHIFDLTHMTWICSSNSLGYETMMPEDQEDDFFGPDDD